MVWPFTTLSRADRAALRQHDGEAGGPVADDPGSRARRSPRSGGAAARRLVVEGWRDACGGSCAAGAARLR